MPYPRSQPPGPADAGSTSTDWLALIPTLLLPFTLALPGLLLGARSASPLRGSNQTGPPTAHRVC